MKINQMGRVERKRVIATFGGAALLRSRDGRMELCGGTASDWTEAKEWVSLFMHEAVPRLSMRRLG